MGKQRSLQQRLSSRPALVGFLQTQPNPQWAEMAGMCGCDFLLLDGEHGAFAEQDYLQTFQALAGVDVASMVRMRNHDTAAIGRYMDMGVDAILVPNVTVADQVTALVRAMSYPPAGTRGFAASMHRTTSYGMEMADHMKAPRQGVSLLAIIESVSGVDNADEILAVDGLDGVIIGPFDLTADLGRIGDFSQPAFSQAMERIEQAATLRGKLLGTTPHHDNTVEKLFARGHRLFIIGADMPLMREAIGARVAEVKSWLDA